MNRLDCVSQREGIVRVVCDTVTWELRATVQGGLQVRLVEGSQIVCHPEVANVITLFDERRRP